MNLLLDMNLPTEWVDFLSSADIPARHWSSVGDPRAQDSTIMAFARENRSIVMTQDLDFGILLAHTHATGPSVIQLRVQDTFPGNIGWQVLEVLRHLAADLERGALVTITKDRSRVRILPLTF